MINLKAQNLEDLAAFFDLQSEKNKAVAENERRMFKAREFMARSETYAECARIVRDSRINGDEK